MPYNPNYPMRLWTQYVSPAANTSQQQFTVTTEDDYRDRYIETIFCGLSVSGFSIALFATGQEYSLIDTTRFAAGDAILQVRFDVLARLQLVVVTQDLNGSARTNVPIIFGYRVDPTQGP